MTDWNWKDSRENERRVSGLEQSNIVLWIEGTYSKSHLYISIADTLLSLPFFFFHFVLSTCIRTFLPFVPQLTHRDRSSLLFLFSTPPLLYFYTLNQACGPVISMYFHINHRDIWINQLVQNSWCQSAYLPYESTCRTLSRQIIKSMHLMSKCRWTFTLSIFPFPIPQKAHIATFQLIYSHLDWLHWCFPLSNTSSTHHTFLETAFFPC